MINSKSLYDMSQIDIEKVDSSTLVSIQAITINQELPHENKVLSVIEQMRDCESSDDWSNLSFFLQGYYTGSSTQNDVRWAIIHNDLTFYVYRYYLGEMVDCFDQILWDDEAAEEAVHE